ncbi:MAG: MFS transporter [Dehalococcoidia bacterium]|tara:strand:- start:5460 stop:6731 length:1272 start_codon:yes stop_codon:yes gene_type:complete
MNQLAKFIQKNSSFYYGWIIVAGSGSTMFVRNAAATLTIAVFVYPMSEDLGWSRTLIVGASSLAGILSVFISPLSGYLIQKYGSKKTLFFSVSLLGISTLLISRTFNPITFYILFGIGRIIFSSPIQIGASTIVAKWFINNRGKATGILGLSHSLGMGLFPLFAQLIIDLDGNNPDSWRMSWIFIGLMVWFISLPLVFFTMVDDPKQIDSKDKKYLELKNNLGNKGRNDSSISLKNALKTRPFWMLSMVGFLTYFIHTGVNIHQAAYLIDKGINPIFAASALTIMALGTGVGSLVTGWATDKFSSKIVYFFGCIWLGLSALLFLLISNIFLAYLIGFIFGMALGGLLVIPPVVLADIFGKDNIGSIRGYSEPFVSAGQAIGGISAGLIYDFTGSYTLSFPMFAFIALLACIFIIFSSNVKKNK